MLEAILQCRKDSGPWNCMTEREKVGPQIFRTGLKRQVSYPLPSGYALSSVIPPNEPQNTESTNCQGYASEGDMIRSGLHDLGVVNVTARAWADTEGTQRTL